MSTSSARDYAYVALVYTAAWIWLLLNNGFIYWDDWGLLPHDSATRNAFYAMVAAPQKGMMHNFLLEIGNGVMVYRVIVFVAYLVTAWCFLWILRHIRQAESGYPLLIAMLAAVYPVNQARIALIDMPYGLNLATFALGTVFAMVAEYRQRLLPRVLALALFAFSFFTKSFLVFYAVPVALMLYVSRATVFGNGMAGAPFRLVFWGLRRLDYLLLPILFFLLANRYLVPNTLYAGYNTVQPDDLPRAMLASLRSMANLSWFPAVRWYGDSSLRHLLIGVSLVMATALLALAQWSRIRRHDWRSGWWIALFLGGLLLLLAIFPYQVVNKTPAFDDWLSRHQLLFPFGCAILLVAYLRLVLSGAWARKAIVVMIAVSVVVVTRDMLWYYADGVRQIGIVAALKELKPVQAARNQVVLFDDQSQQSNAMNRFYRSYELSAYLRQAYGDASRLGELRVLWYTWTPEIVQRRARWRHFNIGDFNAESIVVAGTVTIAPGSYQADSTWQRIGLLVTGITDSDALHRRARDMVRLSWEPWAEG